MQTDGLCFNPLSIPFKLRLTLVLCFFSALQTTVFAAMVPEKTALQLMESDLEKLSEVRSLETSATFRKLFKTEFQGQNLERWFRDRIENVEYSADRSAVLAGIQLTAINDSTPEKPKHMVLLPHYSTPKVDWIERVAVLIHEARHSDSTEANPLEHIKCPSNHPNNLFRDKKVCDRNIHGSYGYELVFLREIAKNCDSCDRDTQERARELYLKYQDRVLDFKLPLDN